MKLSASSFWRIRSPTWETACQTTKIRTSTTKVEKDNMAQKSHSSHNFLVLVPASLKPIERINEIMKTTKSHTITLAEPSSEEGASAVEKIIRKPAGASKEKTIRTFATMSEYFLEII